MRIVFLVLLRLDPVHVTNVAKEEVLILVPDMTVATFKFTVTIEPIGIGMNDVFPDACHCPLHSRFLLIM